MGRDIHDLGSLDGHSPRVLGAAAVDVRGEVAGSALVAGEVVGFVWSLRTGTMTTSESIASVDGRAAVRWAPRRVG